MIIERATYKPSMDSGFELEDGSALARASGLWLYRDGPGNRTAEEISGLSVPATHTIGGVRISDTQALPTIAPAVADFTIVLYITVLAYGQYTRPVGFPIRDPSYWGFDISQENSTGFCVRLAQSGGPNWTSASNTIALGKMQVLIASCSTVTGCRFYSDGRLISSTTSKLASVTSWYPFHLNVNYPAANSVRNLQAFLPFAIDHDDAVRLGVDPWGDFVRRDSVIFSIPSGRVMFLPTYMDGSPFAGVVQ